jgi:hypothetical protein
MRLPKPSRRAVIGAAVASCLVAVTVAAYAAADSASSRRGDAMQQLAAGGGPTRFARAYGLNPQDAVPVFRLRNGQAVAVVGNATAKCMIRQDGAENAETCDDIEAIDEGQAISVLDECATNGRNLMEITGLAPEGVSAARLLWSDGRTEDAALTQGTFKFDSSNPAPRAPYPTGIAWLEGDNAVGHAVFPVQGDAFCLPTS